MSLLRIFLLSVICIVLSACNLSEDDEYQGPPALNGAQKLQASEAVNKMGQLQRTVEVLDGSKDADQDIEDLVNLILSRCEVQNESKGNQSEGETNTYLSGNDCTVNANSALVWRTVPVNGEDFLDATSSVNYATADPEFLALLDVQSLSSVSKLPAGGYPSLSLEAVLTSIGAVSINDSLTAKLVNNNVRATFFRKMSVADFVVEARVIMIFQVIVDDNGDEALDLIDLQLYINGQPVTLEEMSTIFPDALSRLENSNDLILKSIQK